MIASNVPLFQAISELPIIFDPSRLDEGDGIEETLRKNHAKYHQSCQLMFNNTKLERAKKRQLVLVRVLQIKDEARCEEPALKCEFAFYVRRRLQCLT